MKSKLNNKKPIIILSIIIGLILILGFGYYIITNNSEKNTEITFGIIAPLTGNASYIGDDIKNGVLLAVEEINLNGGIDGKLIVVDFQDDQYDAKTTVSAYQNLMISSKPDLIICAGIAQAIIPLVEEDKIPMLATINSVSGIPQQGEYTFRYFTNADVDSPVIANYAMDTLGKNSFAVLYTNDSFGDSYYNVFKETVEKKGGIVVAAESMSYSDQDYATQLTKIKSTNPDAIYIIGLDNQIIGALNRMHTLDMDKSMTILATGTISTPDGTAAVGELNLEVYNSAFCVDESDKAYIQKYMTKYDSYPGYFSAFGYDSVYLGVEAIKKGKKDIKDGFLEIKGYPTTVGEVSSDEFGEFVIPTCPKRLTGEGQYNLVTGKFYQN